ncbi:MAG: O-antigen ligase family protein [Symploca sp. SIO1A3]|nr:O-antigen ligase family protein [Symploca sp. SIO1A3]
MKALLVDLIGSIRENRIFLLILLLTFASYGLLVVLYANKRQKIALILEKAFLIFFLCCLTGCRLTPFLHWHPTYLIQPPLNFILAYFQLVIYAFMLVTLFTRVKFFANRKLLKLLQLSIISNPFFWGLLVMAMMSISWSSSPLITLKAVMVLACINILAIYLVGQYEGQELFDIPMWSMAVMGLMSFVIRRKSNVGGSHGGGLAGVLPSKNQLGILMAVATVLWYLRANHQSKQRWLSWGIAAISFMLIPQTKSSGALVLLMTLFALVVSTNFLKKLKFQYAVIGITSLLFITMLISILIVTNLEQIVGALGRDLTLTGRTEIWADYWAAAQQRLWLGYAPYGFWQHWLGVNNPAEKWNTRWWMPPHAHNGFLDVTLDLGLIGLGILLLSFLVTLIQAIQYLFNGKGGESSIPLILLMYAFQVNLSETQFLRPYLLWFLYVLVTVKLSVTFVSSNKSKNHLS